MPHAESKFLQMMQFSFLLSGYSQYGAQCKWMNAAYLKEMIIVRVYQP